jgi:anti-sigma factor RsiW
MTCNSARELIPLYVGSDLSEERLTQVRDHLAQCGDCARELEKFESCRELVAELAVAPELSKSDVNEMWSAIRQEIAVAPASKIVRFGPVLFAKLAAVIVIGICVGYSAYGVASLFKAEPQKTPTAQVTSAPENPGDIGFTQFRNAAERQNPQQNLLIRKLEEDIQNLNRKIIELQSDNEKLTKRLVELQTEKK